MSFATFKCDACPATAEGEWDGLEGENAPAGWVTVTKTPLDRSRIGGHRGGATSETLCPECHAKRDTTAARLAELEEKILGLGREAKHVDTIVADDISNGLHEIPPDVWKRMTENLFVPAKRFTEAEVVTLIDTATECVDAHEDHLRCVRELVVLRELGNRLALFEEGGKYCRTCSEKSTWEAIRDRDWEAQNHAEWCVVPQWLRHVPEDNTIPLRFRTREIIHVPPRHGMSRGAGVEWYAQGPEERDV